MACLRLDGSAALSAKEKGNKMELPERFWNMVHAEPNSGCWLWDGADSGKGYGKFWYNGKSQSAHRISYEAHIGPVPNGLELDHLCRMRNCVNPDHLEPVTGAENCRRGNTGQNHATKTHCPQGHPYSGNNLHIRSNGSRTCLECNRDRERLRRQKKREDAATIEATG